VQARGKTFRRISHLRGANAQALIAIALLALACGEEAVAPQPPGAANTATSEAGSRAKAATAPPADPVALAEKGRTYYLSSCIACHNSDPAVDGALGPAVAGSSSELIEARVMHAEYPAGYTPKRDTRVMVAMPFLEKQLPALAAYLAPGG
jgi:mono/diheme cytochrome c family protein